MSELPLSIQLVAEDQANLSVGDIVSFEVGLGADEAGDFFSGTVEIEEDLDGALIGVQLIALTNGRQESLGASTAKFHRRTGATWIVPSRLRRAGTQMVQVRLLRKVEERPWEDGSPLEQLDTREVTVTAPAGRDALVGAPGPDIGLIPMPTSEPTPPSAPSSEDAQVPSPPLAPAAAEWDLWITSDEHGFSLSGAYSGFDVKEQTASLPMTRPDLWRILEPARKDLNRQSRQYAKTLKAELEAAERRKRATEATQAVAKIGWKLYKQVLFSDLSLDSSDPRARLVRKLGQLEEGSRIIVHNNQLALPWNILYGQPPRPPGVFDKDDLKHFWGYKYRIQEWPRVSDEDRHMKLPVKSLCAWIDPTLGDKSGGDLLKQIANEHRASFESKRHDARGCPTELLPVSIESVDDPAFDPKLEISEAVMREGASHILYFFCHGAGGGTFKKGYMRPELASLKLTTRGEAHRLHSDDLEQWRMAWLRQGLDLEPLVFLNCCESAQFDPWSSHHLVKGFLNHLRARAVVGSSWEVPGPFAHEFAQDLFDRILGDAAEGVGDALYRLRRQYLEQMNPFGLVFTYFGDSLVKVV